MVAMLMLAMVAQGPGGEPPAGSPEAVVRAFFDDIAAERWRAAAERYHPDVVEKLRTGMVERARAEAERPPVEPADLYPPDMPEEVRDYFERRRAQSWQQYEPEPPWMSLDTVEAWSGVTLLARMLEWSDPRTEVRRQMRAQGAPDAVRGLAERAVRRQHVIGSVAQGDVAYVIYESQQRFGPPSPGSGAVVAELRRTGGTWRIASPLPGDGGWYGYADLSYVFAMAQPPAEAAPPPIFRWPVPGDPVFAASIDPDTPGAVRLEVRTASGTGTAVLPPEAVEALVAYLNGVHFTGGGR